MTRPTEPPKSWDLPTHPDFNYVLRQFKGHTRGGWERTLGRWLKRYNLSAGYRVGEIRIDWWTHDKIGAEFDTMAKYNTTILYREKNGRNFIEDLPRRQDLPITVAVFQTELGQRYGLLDGRHRGYQWRRRPGKYPVLLVHIEEK